MNDMTSCRRQLLIWSALMLTTGYAAPAFAQNVGEGWGHGLARTQTAYPSCVYEQTGHPFSGLYGWGDVHEWGDCTDPVLFHYWSFGPSQCWAGGWSMQSGDLAWFHVRTVWAPDGTLTALQAFAAEAGNVIGQWGGIEGGGAPPEISWDDFAAGTPVTQTIDFAGDWQYWGWVLGGYSQFGVPDPAGLFVAAHGCLPWNSAVEVRVDWLGGGLLFRDGAVYGGNVRLSLEVVAYAAADFNRDLGVDAADIFAFLSAWFAGDALAGACDGRSGCEVADVFAFLSDWFRGS